MEKQSYTLAQIRDHLNLELRGNAELVITGIAPLQTATAEQVSFLVSGGMRKHLATTKAGAIILRAKDADAYQGNALITENPHLAYAHLTELFSRAKLPIAGIRDTAIIGDNCNIAKSVAIAPHCVIGDGVSIGENSVISAGCVIADGVTIGSNCYLYPRVSIYHEVIVGENVIIHSGAVLGADGFGMAADEQGKWHKIWQLGSVVIGNDVEIGANTCIDRGSLGNTVIEDGVKLDNQIQIGHNVRVGANTVMAGCSGVAGSTKIGKHCMIGGMVAFKDNIEVTDRVIITGASALGKDITEPGVYSSGIPVQPHRNWMRAVGRLLQLDALFKKLQKLEEMYRD